MLDMSILDNIPCDGGPFPPDVERVVLCEHCERAPPMAEHELCRACADAYDEADSDPLAVTLIDIAQTRIDHLWMRDLLSVLTDQERTDIVAAGRL